MPRVDSLRNALPESDNVGVRVFGERLRDSLSFADCPEKNVRPHDSLEAVSADCLGDMDETVSVLDVRRFFDEKTGVQLGIRHATPRNNATPERCEGARLNLAERLTHSPISGLFNKCDCGSSQLNPARFIPVVFDGMLDRNTPLPIFRCELLPCVRSTGARRTAPTGERPHLSPMEN